MPSIMSSSGEVTIPKPIRDHLGIEPGAAVEFRTTASGEVILERAAPAAPRKRSNFAAVVGSAGPGPTTDELMLMLRGDPDDDYR